MSANIYKYTKYEWQSHLGGYSEEGEARGNISYKQASSQNYFDGRGPAREWWEVREAVWWRDIPTITPSDGGGIAGRTQSPPGAIPELSSHGY